MEKYELATVLPLLNREGRREHLRFNYCTNIYIMSFMIIMIRMIYMNRFFIPVETNRA